MAAMNHMAGMRSKWIGMAMIPLSNHSINSLTMHGQNQEDWETLQEYAQENNLLDVNGLKQYQNPPPHPRALHATNSQEQNCHGILKHCIPTTKCEVRIQTQSFHQLDHNLFYMDPHQQILLQPN